MAKLFIVIGLPGSGKTTRVGNLVALHRALAADDFHKFAIDNRPDVPYSRHYPRVIHALRSGRPCVVADVSFCDPARLAELERVIRAMVPDVEVVREYFANDREQCLANVTRRDSPEVAEEIAAINALAPVYRVPAGVAVRPVYRGLAVALQSG
jgi:predicted kinase